MYIIDPAGVAYLKDNYIGKKGIKVIHIKCGDQDRIERMQKRGDSDEAIFRRFTNDKIMFANVGNITDFSVVNASQDLCAQEIAKYINRQEAKS